MADKGNQVIRQEIMNRTFRPNSLVFRYGGTGTEVKVYFDDAGDLESQMLEMDESAENIRKHMDSVKGKLGNPL